MDKKLYKVLVIEDDPNYFVLLNERLSRHPHFKMELIRSKQMQSGLERLQAGDIDIVLLDLTLPDSQGLQSFLTVHKNFPAVPVIILTCVDDDQLAAQAIAQGAQDYLTKGSFDRDLLVKSIQYAISRNQIQAQLQKYHLETETSKRTLQDREDRFRSLVSNIPGAVYRFTVGEGGQGIIEFISGTIESISGLPAEDFMGKEFSNYQNLILPQDLSTVKEAFAKAVEKGESFGIDYRIRHKNGDFRWVHDQARGIKSASGKITHVDGVIFDITERTKEKERFNQLVYYDALTGLPNRELFTDRLNQALQQTQRKNESCAVLVMDLDHFKRINDTLGHVIGDQLIKAVSVRILKTVFNTDTITRMSGGSFMILLPRLGVHENAENVANKILTAFKTPFRINDHELFTTCSIGIAISPGDGTTSEVLMKNADAAMHLAKERGKDCYQLFSSAITNNSFERLVLENSLRRALERNEFKLHYQPQLSIKSGKIVGVEALIRWQHPDLGSIPPMEFIPVAEDTGLIHAIGDWVLQAACEQKKIWNKMGFADLRVAINLSARQFHYTNLVELITGILAKVDLDPRGLELELTESTLMDRLEETTETLRKLKETGLSISIDDFGTGYSSLMYLKTFPIDSIKIDKSFVRDITTDTDDLAITQAIISMAHSLKLEVVAEGVETSSQLELLKSQGCDIIQGYLFSKAVPAEEITPLMVNGAAKRILSGTK